MDYKVLYRKYRPQTFDEVVGQSNTVRLLKDSIVDGKISHAYIFSGPRGTGKTSTAKIFAKAINCSHSKDGNPCNECDLCINSRNSSDIYEIDAASNNGVDQIREIIDNVKLSPISSKYKVYIIDEVHMLSTSAFNALLLTLEEPPSHVVFILATTNIESVPITILSRCQRLDFKKISDKDIFDRLKEVSKAEKIKITDDAINEIAYCADGGLRDALSILDQLSKKKCDITADMVLDVIGIISNKSVTDLIDSIEKGNVEGVIEFINNAKALAVDYKSLIRKIIDQVRERCILIKKNEFDSNVGYSNYKKLCFELANTLYKASVNIDSYSMLELILLEYVDDNTKLVESKEEKISKTETETKKVVSKAKKVEEKDQNDTQNYFPGNIFELTDIRINNCFVEANKAKLTENKGKWLDFIQNNASKSTKGMLMDTEIVLSSDSIMVIKTELEENAQLINECLDDISTDYKKYSKQEYLFIAVDENHWKEKTSEYLENKKKGIKYTILDEPKANNESKILDDVFPIDKVEIK